MLQPDTLGNASFAVAFGEQGPDTFGGFRSGEVRPERRCPSRVLLPEMGAIVSFSGATRGAAAATLIGGPGPVDHGVSCTGRLRMTRTSAMRA